MTALLVILVLFIIAMMLSIGMALLGMAVKLVLILLPIVGIIAAILIITTILGNLQNRRPPQ